MIGYSKRASCTNAFALLVEGWNEMVQEGWTPDGVAVSPVRASDEVFYAVSKEGDIVGAMAFRTEDDAIRINLSYVEPSSRRRGIYRQMLDELLKLARERSILKLISEVSTENKVMRAVLHRTGRRAVAVVFELTVPE